MRSTTASSGRRLETPPQSGQIEPKFIKFFGADPGCATGDNASSEVRLPAGILHSDDGGDPTSAFREGAGAGRRQRSSAGTVDPQLTNSGADKTMRTVFIATISAPPPISKRVSRRPRGRTLRIDLAR